MVAVHPTVEYILYTTCTLGVLGALFIIITYATFRDIRNRFGISLLYYLSIANLLDCIAFFPWNVEHKLCVPQAFVIHYFQVASFFWSAFIGFSVFAVIYLDKMFDSPDLSRSMRWFHAISWGGALLATVPPLIFEEYGKNENSMEPWCYTPNGDDLIRLMVYVPCIVTLVFNVIIFIAVRVKLSKWHSEESKTLKMNVTLYVASFVLSQTPPLINRIQNYVDPNHPMLALIIMQISLQPLQSFWNAIIFILTEPDCIELYTLLVCQPRCRRKRKLREQFYDYETTRLTVNYDEDDKDDIMTSSSSDKE